LAVDLLADDPTFADMLVGFHAQQAIEKLKAVLSDSQIAYPRVNDLDRLIQLLEAEQFGLPAEDSRPPSSTTSRRSTTAAGDTRPSECSAPPTTSSHRPNRPNPST